MYPACFAAARIILPEPISVTPVFAAHYPGRRRQVPARFTEQPHAATKGLGPCLASHRPGTGRSAAGHKPWPGVWSPRATGRLAPTARASLHLAVYRLRAGDLATAVKRDGQGSNP
jgi:hypothetical protein